MKMGKKKLKFKFLFAFLICVLSIGLVSTKTYAYSTNGNVGDIVSGFDITGLDSSYSSYVNLVEFSNGWFISYDNVDDTLYLMGDDIKVDEEIITDIMNTGSIDFDDYGISSLEIVNIWNYDDLIVNIDFDIVEYSFFGALFDVFSGIGSKIMLLISSLVVIFYANNQLTFLGILALCGLGIAIILLILNIIQNFLHFRG